MTCEPVQIPRAPDRAGMGATGNVVQCPAASTAADPGESVAAAGNSAAAAGGEAGADVGTNTMSLAG
jgi:hypothetical protein